ncbi:putative nucleotidyltransferase [Bradyrhizobium oligotrophicum S58]|uniref:Putative nucleotidyltransferase n=1 Tax=Bradyrhizobium oligotrophicum S58 TaxID=1245469 RepID=M4ZBS9_9BRAD|nr:putative nucleotidyltransferase [Bradyrhizobium oligotrophicum S58]
MNDVADIPLMTIIGRLQALAPALRSAGITRLSLFGSRARGDARPDSDLDVLVETTAPGLLPAFDHFKVQHLIEDDIGLRVQITQRALLKRRIADRIADDLIEVF